MQINRKQFYNTKWYNKYSAALAIAILNFYNSTGIKLIYSPDEFDEISENLYQKLIDYSKDPNDKKEYILNQIEKISKGTIDFNLKSIELILSIIENIIEKGEEDEYLYISNLVLNNENFHILSGLGDNMKKNIGILQTFIMTWHGMFRKSDID